ncbi:hypothetical protein D3C87_1703560 [compost metagenome]
MRHYKIVVVFQQKLTGLLETLFIALHSPSPLCFLAFFILANFTKQLLDMASVSNGFVNLEDQLRGMAQADRFAKLRAEKASGFLNRL